MSSSLCRADKQELQRFPRLQAQLVEVVSDLLRERLGPTSEYVSSLIQIQAAYINTNHPNFVQDSAMIAREGPKPVAPKAPSHPSIHSDDEDDRSSDDAASGPPNGGSASLGGSLAQHQQNHHVRSASTSVPDIRRPSSSTAKPALPKRHQRTGSGTVNPGPNANNLLQPGAPASTGSSPHGAKESFLNYFFGGPNGAAPVTSAPPSSSASDMTAVQRGSGHHGRSSHGQTPRRDLLPDLGTNRRGGSSRGLDSATTAYDMKSLGKHIEAVSLI